MSNRFGSVGLRLVCYALAFAWGVTLLVSGLQMWQARRSEVERLDRLLDQIVIGSEVQMADLVWEEDAGRATQVAENMLRTTDVTYVLVRSDNAVLAEVGRRPELFLERNIVLRSRHGQPAPSPFGDFTIRVDLDTVDKRVEREFRGILVRTSILIFALVGIILLLFRYMVARHLKAIGRFFDSLTVENLERPLRLDRAPARVGGGDEFDRLLGGIARMQSTVAEEFRRRQQAEAEVRQLNEVLEATVAERTAELVEKNQLLERLSTTDPLTQIPNRLKLEEMLRYELSRCERNRAALSLIILDVDQFKSVNDVYGHPVGDQVLVEVASTLQRNIRKVDVLGRWGGEEFIILCVDTEQTAAAAVAEKLRRAIAAHDIPIVEAKTASFGVSSFRLGDSVEALIARADAAMYRGKQQGRNRVVVYCDACMMAQSNRAACNQKSGETA